MLADEDVEAQRQMAKQAFEVPGVRRAFIRKVALILMVQFTFTIGSMLLTMAHEDVALWILEISYFTYIATFAIICASISILCCRKGSRYPPCNFVILGMVTLAQAFFLCILAVYFPSGVVLLALGLSAAVVLAMIIFTLQSKIDLTIWSGTLLVILIVFFFLAIILIYFPSKTMIYLYAALGVIIFSVLLVYHFQLVIGGRTRSLILTPDDYVFAAAAIYIDIILLFSFILKLIGLDV